MLQKNFVLGESAPSADGRQGPRRTTLDNQNWRDAFEFTASPLHTTIGSIRHPSRYCFKWSVVHIRVFGIQRRVTLPHLTNSYVNLSALQNTRLKPVYTFTAAFSLWNIIDPYSGPPEQNAPTVAFWQAVCGPWRTASHQNPICTQRAGTVPTYKFESSDMSSYNERRRT